MTHVDAIYQGGVFRPLGPVALSENQRVALSIEPIAKEDMLEWIKRTEQLRAEVASRCGTLPDSTIDIAMDRMR
jgi:predicted DNA-binding antitoxin AbrB/MazE fold protein